MSFDVNLILIGLVVFLFAGTIKGLVGIGLPVTSVGVLSQIVDPRVAVLMAIFPILVSNIWQVYRSGGVMEAIRRYATLAVTLMVSLFVTTFFARNVPTDVLILAIGLIIVLFSATSLAFKPPFLPEKYDKLGQFAAGLISGVFGGLTAIWAAPIVVYFLSRRLDSAEFVRASGLLLLSGAVPLFVGYINNGLITGEVAALSGMMIVPTLVGFALGERLRRRLDASRFRMAVLIMFLVMGLNLLREAVF